MWKFMILATFSVLWAFKVSDGIDVELLEKKHNGTGCNTTHSANNSGIALNDHKLAYPCTWRISSHNLVRLYFEQVFLDDGDSLVFYKTVDDAHNKTNPLKKMTMFPNGVTTLITKESDLVLSLERGKESSYLRKFEAFYSLDDCMYPVPPTVDTLYAPTYMDDVTTPIDCIYHFNQIQHERAVQVFTFEEFNMTTSQVHIEGATLGGEYKGPVTDFFIDKNSKLVTITVSQQKTNSTDHFKLKINTVDKACSGRFELDNDITQPFTSPPDVVNNGSYIFECRWLIQHKNSEKILGFQLNTADFTNVFDIAAVNDGASKISAPILQVTTSNKNASKNQIIRGTGSSLWVAYKPENYKSKFSFNATVHGQGGYYKGSGTINMAHAPGNDTAFLLEVDKNEVVMLTFSASSITAPASVSVYDGFDTSNLLTSIHGSINYPILSRSSRMMVIGTSFDAASNHFSAAFKGVVPGCNHMSSMSAENYILSENCNSSCVWIIPPQKVPNSALVVYLQYISLKDGDIITIHKLDAKLTQLAEISPSENHVPHFAVPSDIGVLININQSKCEKSQDKLVLVGHSSYIPACNHDITTKTSESLQISSPLYPDTYPLFTTCKYNLTAPKESVIHMAFQTLNLAENHCIKISHGSGAPNVFQGKTLPNDLFFYGNVLVEFDSSGCNKSTVSKTLNSDSGFLMNVNVTDCGGIMEGGKGNFSTTANKSVCIWKVSVPIDKEGDKIVAYNVKKMDSFENYELNVYDGSTVRDSKILNNSDSEIWARTNTLIFVYKRLNVSNPSSALFFKYTTIECKEHCVNRVCMHPNWKCDGVNDCGDYTDERNCGSVPIPPEVKFTGYSGTAFWLVAFAMLLIGSIGGLAVPVCYQRYKDSQYRRFQELDS